MDILIYVIVCIVFIAMGIGLMKIGKLKDVEKSEGKVEGVTAGGGCASLIGAAMIFSALFIIFIVVVGSILQ